MSHNIEHWTMEYTPNNPKKEERNRINLENKAEEYAERVDWEEGGGLNRGFRWLERRIYDNYEEAEEAIEELDEGDYDNLAVLYRDYGKVKPSAKMKAIDARLEDMRKKYVELEKTSTTDLNERKSAFLGCKNCGSKLATKYLHFSKCPVCGAELRSDTVMNRLANMTKKIKELNKEHTMEEKKLKNKAETRWLVKFEFHS